MKQNIRLRQMTVVTSQEKIVPLFIAQHALSGIWSAGQASAFSVKLLNHRLDVHTTLLHHVQNKLGELLFIEVAGAILVVLFECHSCWNPAAESAQHLLERSCHLCFVQRARPILVVFCQNLVAHRLHTAQRQYWAATVPH